MEYTLTLREDILSDEDGRRHIVYGLDAIDYQGTTRAFPDISFEKQTVLHLMRLCLQEQIALCHLGDIVEDTVITQHLVD